MNERRATNHNEAAAQHLLPGDPSGHSFTHGIDGKTKLAKYYEPDHTVFTPSTIP